MFNLFRVTLLLSWCDLYSACLEDLQVYLFVIRRRVPELSCIAQKQPLIATSADQCIMAPAFRSRGIHGVLAKLLYSPSLWFDCGIMRRPRMYCFVSSTSGMVFNTSTGSVINDSQWAKDIDLNFKFQNYAAVPDHRKPVFILSNLPSELGERAHCRNKFFPWVGYVHTTSWFTVKYSTTGPPQNNIYTNG